MCGGGAVCGPRSVIGALTLYSIFFLSSFNLNILKIWNIIIYARILRVVWSAPNCIQCLWSNNFNWRDESAEMSCSFMCIILSFSIATSLLSCEQRHSEPIKIHTTFLLLLLLLLFLILFLNYKFSLFLMWNSKQVCLAPSVITVAKHDAMLTHTLRSMKVKQLG